jgi:hypothetical protein
MKPKRVDRRNVQAADDHGARALLYFLTEPLFAQIVNDWLADGGLLNCPRLRESECIE